MNCTCASHANFYSERDNKKYPWGLSHVVTSHLHPKVIAILAAITKDKFLMALFKKDDKSQNLLKFNLFIVSWLIWTGSNYYKACEEIFTIRSSPCRMQPPCHSDNLRRAMETVKNPHLS